MIKLQILLFFTVFLLAKEDFTNSFITQYEYGKMLYSNPRGISCTTCHGIEAKGKVITEFVHIRNKIRYNCDIRTEDITNISYQEFLQTLDPKLEKPKKKFAKDQVCEKLAYGNSMPKYFLTPEELKSIYFYLTNMDKYE